MVVSAVPIKVDECRDRDKGFAWVFSFVPIFPANAMKNHCFIFSRIALVLVAVTFHSRAAMLTVTTTSDTGPGSLRERIEATGIGDTIVFASSVTGMITLTNGDLILRRTTFIDGPGPNVLTISGFGSNGVFQIANFGDYRISGLTVANGASWAGNGGGIYNDGSLTVLNSTISSNQATLGGGILNNLNTATLTIINSTIAGNIASSGGGILASGSLAMTNCTISGNRAIGGFGNGGMGSGSGGGLYNLDSLALYSCTVASNLAAGSSFDFGGGIYDSGTTLLLRSCTVAGNEADFGGGLSGSGNLGNTILAGNIAGTDPDCSGFIISSDYNLIQNTSGATITGTTAHNLTGQNPLLAPLQDNGGSTLTLALLAGSPAIDKGKSGGVAIDQRGAPRPFDKSIANAAGGDGTDIGAFEVGGLAQLALIPQTANSFSITIATDAGQNYDVQRTQDLNSGNWVPVASNVAGTGGPVTVPVPDEAQPQVFYRVRLVP